MSESTLCMGEGPYIVFPHNDKAFVCQVVTARDAQNANVIIATQTMEVMKNRYGPSGPISGAFVNLMGAQDQIDKAVRNMSRKGKW